MDTFDSSYPTKAARHGTLLTADGSHINIKSGRYIHVMGPVDPTCYCYTCRTFSLGYLHHLFKVGEINGLILATIHNLYQMNNFCAKLRADIAADII